MQRKITCHCGNIVEYSFPERIDISQSPEFISQILENTFLQITCGSCGEVLKPDLPMIFNNVDTPLGELCIEYIPELERTSYLIGNLDTSCERIVIGYPELREKFMIFNHKMDDRAVEILKFFLLEKAESQDNVTILLQDIDREQLSFYLYGLKEGEVGLSRVPLSLYEKVNSTYDERVKNDEVYRQISQPPYISINKISLEEEA